jgi:hypothetical protein
MGHAKYETSASVCTRRRHDISRKILPYANNNLLQDQDLLLKYGLVQVSASSLLTLKKNIVKSRHAPPVTLNPYPVSNGYKKNSSNIREAK